MAQVKIPGEFLLQLTLLTNIVTQNNKPGFDSPLTDWLIENKIDLDADTTAGNQAKEKDDLRIEQEALSKKSFENRDALFTPAFAFIRGAAQVLKKYYTQRLSMLADWGLPITDTGRLAYPPSFEEKQAIGVVFFTKLLSYGHDKNPLTAFIAAEEVNVADLATNNEDSAKENMAADRAAKAAENATEQRNLLWENPLAHIHLIADFLKSVYANNPRALGNWGFVVDESVAVEKERKVKLIIGETRTLTNIIVGSILQNMGKGDAIVYKGKKVGGVSTVLKVNEKMGMVKGYSSITVVNPSTLETLSLVIVAPEE